MKCLHAYYLFVSKHIRFKTFNEIIDRQKSQLSIFEISFIDIFKVFKLQCKCKLYAINIQTIHHTHVVY